MNQGDFKLLAEQFSLFKEKTKEEEKILELITRGVAINEHTTVLDIGSNSGVISHAIQPKSKSITLVDVESFDLKTGAKFLKGKWEEIVIENKYDLIIASHVWGHFHHEKTTNTAFLKALNCLSENGNFILCYNLNDGFMSELLKFSNNLFRDFQYDVFDESILKDLKLEIIDFSVNLSAKTFEELAALIQVLVITTDKIFEANKPNVCQFLRSKLSTPSFDISQRLVIVRSE